MVAYDGYSNVTSTGDLLSGQFTVTDCEFDFGLPHLMWSHGAWHFNVIIKTSCFQLYLKISVHIFWAEDGSRRFEEQLSNLFRVSLACSNVDGLRKPTLQASLAAASLRISERHAVRESDLGFITVCKLPRSGNNHTSRTESLCVCMGKSRAWCSLDIPTARAPILRGTCGDCVTGTFLCVHEISAIVTNQ